MVEEFSILQNDRHAENYHTAGIGMVLLVDSDMDRKVQEKDLEASQLAAADVEVARGKGMSSKVKDWDRKMDATEGSVTVAVLVNVIGTAEKGSGSDDPMVVVVLVENRNWGNEQS